MSQLSKDVLQRLAALYPGCAGPSTFDVKVVPFHVLDDTPLCAFLHDAAGCGKVLGLAALFKPQRKLSVLVVATPTSALLITDLTRNRPAQTRLLETRLLCNAGLRLLAAHAAAIAYGLYTDVGAHTTNAVDSLSIDDADSKSVRLAFSDAFVAGASARRDAVVRARQFAVLGQRDAFRRLVAQACPVCTKAGVPWVLDVAAALHRVSSLIDAQKPVIQNHDVEDIDVRKGKFAMTCRRYKTRVRVRGPRTIELADAHGNTLIGTVENIDGRTVMVSVTDSLPLRLTSVTSRGKEYTLAEEQKEGLLLWLLQSPSASIALSRNPAFCAIWDPDTNDSPSPVYAGGSALPRPPTEFSNFVPAAISGAAARLAGIPLNLSQHKAVRTILRAVSPGKVDVDTIIGPPGTGKTMVIAASVVGLRSMDRPVWLVAHSNVAVKNVAQKLADIGFWDFKLVVSKEFHYGYTPGHEHLYTLINRNVILTSQLQTKGRKRPPIEPLLGGSQVILCTLGTLTGSASRLSSLVPVETLIVDEASQIELGEYLVPMNEYGRTLKKIVFVGDDKQLAPYGQDQIGNLMQTIFEVPKHRARAVMLDTSYRLPRPICEFISRRVYDGKLRTAHALASRDSCKFVDVFNGVETKMGHSWQNAQEAAAAISLARLLSAAGRDFRIITPYDAQRVLIEESLKASGTPWHDRVFCVDSFQGNEAPYIILSTVRTHRPGFLTNVRRTNVMLTRCSRGMYICTSKAFVYSAYARKTLLGELAAEWRGERWITLPEIWSNLSGRPRQEWLG